MFVAAANGDPNKTNLNAKMIAMGRFGSTVGSKFDSQNK